MAEKKVDTDSPVIDTGDHDRVAMLSLRADGTPDQHNPEIIGDKDTAIAATKAQFAQTAVAAADASDNDVDVEKAVAAAEKKAETVVNALHKG